MDNDRNQPQTLSRYCREWQFFSTRDGQTWAQPPAGHPRQLYPIHHPDLRDFLAESFADEFGIAPTNAALRTTLAAFQAHARHNPDATLNPALRIASKSDPPTVAINPGTHQAWEVTAAGGCATEGNFLFFTGRGAEPLPNPVVDRDPHALADFRRLLNLATDDDWLLLLTWLVAAWHPHGPYPILILQGPEGCGKTQAARALRHLVDPNQAPLHTLPTARRLQPHAYENWVLAFDHVARLSPCTAATLAGLSTGIAYEVPIAKEDYIPVHQCRPILLTTTPDCRIPGDIQSRAYIVHLADLPAEARRTETEWNAELDRLRPQILSYLLKGIETALRRRPEIHLATLPRMADAAVWMAAASPAFGLTEQQIAQVLAKPNRIYKKPDPLIPHIQALGDWQGTAQQLLEALPQDQRPPTEKELGNRISKMERDLRLSGIEVTRQRTKKTRRLLFHRKIETSLSPEAETTTDPQSTQSPHSTQSPLHPQPELWGQPFVAAAALPGGVPQPNPNPSPSPQAASDPALQPAVPYVPGGSASPVDTLTTIEPSLGEDQQPNPNPLSPRPQAASDPRRPETSASLHSALPVKIPDPPTPPLNPIQTPADPAQIHPPAISSTPGIPGPRPT